MKKIMSLSCSILVFVSVIGMSNEAAAQPDLYISKFAIQPSSPTQGQSVSVRIGVYNGGTSSSDDFTLAWYPGEKYRHPGCTWRVHKIAARGGKILHATTFIQAGMQKLSLRPLLTQREK